MAHDSDGHHHDQGIRGFLRYMRFLPAMWRSDVNDAVVERLDLHRGDVVVDIGAGMGSGAVPAIAKGAHVIAVEPTGYMRAVLNIRKVMLLSNRKSLSIQKGTAENIGLPANSASAVMAVNALHHWDNIETAAAEIASVVEPEGRVLLVDEQFLDPDHPEFDRFEQEHSHMFEEADVEGTVAALEAAGLVNVKGTKDTIADVPALVFSAEAPLVPQH